MFLNSPKTSIVKSSVILNRKHEMFLNSLLGFVNLYDKSLNRKHEMFLNAVPNPPGTY